MTKIGTKTIQKIYRRAKKTAKTSKFMSLSKNAQVKELKTASVNKLLDLIILIAGMLKKGQHNPHSLQSSLKRKKKNGLKRKKKDSVLKVYPRTSKGVKQKKLDTFIKLANANVRKKRWSRSTADGAINKTKKKLRL